MKIIVFLPCYNEEKTISKVIDDFKKELPEAEIVVFDNNSSDQSVNIARSKGATIYVEKKRGKGNVVKSAFNKLQADIYIMADADDTYPADEVHKLLKPILDGQADMTVGTRLENANAKELRKLHKFGNKFILFILNTVFRSKFKDILSGYRVMNKDFVKGIPLLSEGFEIETEITLQALERGYRVLEIPTKYRERPIGSFSKIETFKDGFKIVFTIISILRDYRPIVFFMSISVILLVLGLLSGGTVLIEYIQTKFVTRIPLAILSTLLIILSFISFMTGFIVSAINRRFEEMNIQIKKSLYKEEEQK
ncbi:MAG: glycosyltransferase family 2 protein [Patescibacteria group bacterium]|jgi:glycosyltransferase involved in cell wall biosynthesis